MIFRTIPVTLIALTATAFLFAFLQWNFIDHAIILGWLALVILLVLIRFVALILYKRYADTVADKIRWGNYNVALVCLQGILWGSGCALMYPPDNPEHQYIVFMITLGLAYGSVSAIGIWPKPMLLFITPLMFIPVPVYLLDGSPMALFTVLATLVLYFYFVKNSINAHRMTHQRISERMSSLANEKELNEIKQRRLDIIEQMVATSSSIQFYVDAGRVYQIVNDSYLAFFDKKRENIIGKRMEDAMPAYLYEREVKPALDTCLSGNRHYKEMWLRGGDHEQHFLAVTMDPHVDARGRVIGAVVTATDITRLKLSEEKTKKSWEMFLAALSATPEAVSIHGFSDRKILFVNPAFEKLLGYSRKELVGSTSSVLDMWVIEEDLHRFMEKFSREAEIHDFQTLTRHRDGSAIPVSITAVPFRLEHESCYVSWIEDRREAIKAENERNRLEIQLSQARKMEAIGQLTGGIAHDFNNILQAILGYCQLAQMTEEAAGSPELSSYLEYISHGGQRAQNMIKQLMLFSRSTPQQSSPQSLQILVNNVLQLLKPSISSSIAINTHIQEKLDKVFIDPVQFEQIVMNLCINARDAIDGTGSIDITLQEVDVLGAVCDSCQESFSGNFVELSIRDSGTGIDAEIMNSIFDPFFSTKELGNGTGLGLSTVHGAVHNHGGHIRVYSTPGKGTEFKLLFPTSHAQEAVEEKRVEIAANPALEQDTGQGRTILIVDDETDITAYLSKLLKIHGYQTRTVNNSLQALEMFKQDGAGIDLMITDQTMPGLSGLELAEQIAKLRHDFPIIICSGNLTDLSMIAGANSQITACLTKPIDSKLLLEKIANALD